MIKENIKTTRMANGLVVLSDKMSGVRSATLGFFLRAGSRNEPNELNGISHFIEHTVFKGTANRTALEIAVEQDRLGGNFDAFTTHEEIGFAIKVIDDRLSEAFGLIADMLANPLFEEKDLKSEQKVIIEEIKMTEDSPEDVLGDIFNEAFFPDHPLGLSIAGTRRTVRSFGPEITREYHRRTFTPANLVIAAAGNIRHEAVVELAQKFWPHGSAAERIEPAKQPKLAAPLIIKQKKHLEQAHLIIAAPLVAAGDRRRYAADLLANILGGGTSSRLWQKIREERGLAYSVGASAIMFNDCGFFSVFAATSPDQVGESIDVTIAELRKVVKNGVTPDELDLVKQQTHASILLGLEDSAVRAATLAHSEILHGRVIPLAETLANIDSVTTDDIQTTAREFFRTENIALAALGDLKGLKVGRERLAIG